jgi:hypothetical protein
LTTPVRIPSRESMRDALARLRYQWAALWHGWGETWEELAERDREKFRGQLPARPEDLN